MIVPAVSNCELFLFSGTELMVSPPDLSDMTDDKQAIELRVTFMNGSTIEPCSDKSPYELQCLVEFSSREPIAYAGNVTFSDNRGNMYEPSHLLYLYHLCIVNLFIRYILPISVSADNCILTVYSYLAANRHQCQLIRQPPSPNQQADGESDTRYATANDTGLRFHCPTGEVVLRPLSMSEVGSITRASTVASASQFAAESSSVSAREGFTYTSIASSTSSAELTVGTPREGARNLPGGPAGNAVISDVEIAADHRKMDSHAIKYTITLSEYAACTSMQHLAVYLTLQPFHCFRQGPVVDAVPFLCLL